MGILHSILEKAGFGEIPKEFVGKTNTPPSAVPLTNLTPPSTTSDNTADLDFVAQLDLLADAHEDDLNWRGSILDLLELLGQHNDLETRRDLAKQLNCPPHIMADITRMDEWLHGAVLRKIADNGGRVPPELFH
jgi:hypothetical protein